MSISDLDIERQEEEYINSALDSDFDYMIYQFDEAMYYIEAFQHIVDNENEYADFVVVTEKVKEYRDMHTTYPNNNFSEDVLETIKKLEASIIELANKLKKEADAIPLSEKKLISVKDFEKVYSISVESQRKLRKRLNDPLPFIQIENRGNVLYNHKEVDKWFENYTS